MRYVRVVSPNTALGDRLRPRRHVTAPGDVGRRVVGAVHVMVLKDGLLVGAVGVCGGRKAVDVDACGIARRGDDAVSKFGTVSWDGCGRGDGAAG